MWMIDTKGSTEPAPSEFPDDVSEITSMMSKHDQMKMNWEKKEEENVYKENVHYQDVLFDGKSITFYIYLKQLPSKFGKD